MAFDRWISLIHGHILQSLHQIISIPNFSHHNSCRRPLFVVAKGGDGAPSTPMISRGEQNQSNLTPIMKAYNHKP